MAPVGTRYDLLRGGSELIELSMLAARAAAAARRIAGGGEADSADRRVFEALGSVFDSAAQSVDFVTSAGKAGSLPSGNLATRVDATIDAVLEDDGIGEHRLAPLLAEFAQSIRGIADTPSQAERMAGFFGGLSTSVLRQAGHSGEVITAL